MKSAAIFLLFVSFASANAQPHNTPFSVTPGQPKIGTTIKVTYDCSSPGAQLKDAGVVELFTLVFRSSEDPLFIDTPMKKEGDTWVCSFQLTDKSGSYMMFRCVSADKSDEGGENGVEAMVYGDDSKPVLGAHHARAYVLSRGQVNSFKRTKDLAGAREEFDREKELYPQNWKAWNDRLGMMYREDQSAEGKANLKPDLEQFAAACGDNEKAVSAIINWYKVVGDTLKAKAIEESLIGKNPDGFFARQSRWSHLFDEQHASKRIGLIRRYLAENPNPEKKDLRDKMLSLFSTCVKAKEYDQAVDVLSKIEDPSWQWYNELAWPLIEKGEQLEKAVEWAKIGVGLSRKADPNEARFYSTLAEWEKGRNYNSGMVLDTYAYGLLQAGKTAEAEESAGEAFKLTGGDDADIAQHYIESMIKNKHFDKAVEVGLECIRQGKSSDQTKDQLKLAYAEKEGSSPEFGKLSQEKQKTFDELLSQAGKSRADAAKKQAGADRLSKPSIDFTLKNLEGTPVSLSSLKGKVVIIDFWATWCGPCKESFPYLQKVYTKYKDNPNVVFLAVDTWERLPDLPSIVENAKKFMADHKYSFPVLFDKIKGKKLSDDYEVDGIPTKFLIDRKGNMAFKSVGFRGPQMEDELTAQIELLLGETM